MSMVVEQQREDTSSQSIAAVLAGLKGQIVTVISTDSYIPTLTGYKIDEEAYKAKVVSFEDGTLKLVVEFLADPQKKVREKAFQFIPVGQVRRITISKNERFITI